MKPKNWEEFINLRNHKCKIFGLNKEFKELIYHPDNINFFLIRNNLVSTYKYFKTEN
jgi:hypothetical protein